MKQQQRKKKEIESFSGKNEINFNKKCFQFRRMMNIALLLFFFRGNKGFRLIFRIKITFFLKVFSNLMACVGMSGVG